MRYVALTLLLTACAAETHESPVIHGRASDPAFCVNTESDGRQYTADDAPPSAAQEAAGVKQGSYPYPARCVLDQ